MQIKTLGIQIEPQYKKGDSEAIEQPRFTEMEGPSSVL